MTATATLNPLISNVFTVTTAVSTFSPIEQHAPCTPPVQATNSAPQFPIPGTLETGFRVPGVSVVQYKPSMGLLHTFRWRLKSASSTATKLPGAEALLTPHSDRIRRIQSLVGMPTTHWLELYEAPIRAYALHLLQRAARAAPSGSFPGGLFEDGLGIAVRALALRQGKLLPTDADGRIGNQDVWTYAIFSAALLHPVATSACGRAIVLIDPCQPATDSDQASAPLLAKQIVPQAGFAWLSQDRDVLRKWSSAIAGRLKEAGDIGALIAEANHHGYPQHTHRVKTPAFSSLAEGCTETIQSGFSFAARFARDMPETTKNTRMMREPLPEQAGHHRAKASVADIQRNPGLAFLGWLRNGLLSRSIGINEASSHLHVAREGLLLVSPAIFRDFDPKNWKQVQRRFTRLRLHQKNIDGNNIHSYVSAHGRKMSTVRGYLLAALPEALSDVPLPSPNPYLSRADGPEQPDGDP